MTSLLAEAVGPGFYGVVFIVFLCVCIAWYITLYVTGSEETRAKLHGMSVSVAHFFLSRDRKWKPPEDTGPVLRRTDIERKRIYFIRHGESMWNEVFNKGFGPSFPFRLIRGVLRELVLLPSADSLFWDSPLSITGLQQSTQLLTWIESASISEQHAQVLRGVDGYSEKTVLVSSNLRRAISTALTCLSARLMRSREEKVHILSSLQEMTRNVDGYALAPARQPPTPSWVEEELPSLSHIVQFYREAGRLDVSDNHGSKPLNLHGMDRFKHFAEWCFSSPAAKGKEYVLAAGHSLYFREFFKAFLPRRCNLPCKTTKMVNCGVVVFDLVKSGADFAIDPDSVTVVYGGFEGRRKN